MIPSLALLPSQVGIWLTVAVLVAAAAAMSAAVVPAVAGFANTETEWYARRTHVWLAALFAVPLLRFSDDAAATAGFLVMAVVAAHLATIDLGEERLPDPLTVAGGAAVVAAFTVSAALPGGRGWSSLTDALIGSFTMLLFFFAVYIAKPHSFGFGDVKLGVLLGFVTGWVGGWPLAWWATLAGLVLQGAGSIILISIGRVDRRTELPLGPALLFGAWGAMLLSSTL